MFVGVCQGAAICDRVASPTLVVFWVNELVTEEFDD